MRVLFISSLAFSLAVAVAASAQHPGGGGPPGGGGGRGHGGHAGHGGGAPGGQGERRPPPPADTPANQVDIVGVVKAIDPAAGRITIAYEPVEELNWPAGTLPFAVAKTAILQQVSVGEKVRFRIESQAITVLEPWNGKPAPEASQSAAGAAGHWRGPRSGGPGGPTYGGPTPQ